MKQDTNIIGIDIGGSKIYTARFSHDWSVEENHRCDTPQTSGKEAILDQIFACISALKNVQTKAIGVSFAGLIDTKGVIVKAPNIEVLSGFDLRAYLEEQFSLPVRIENDAALMTYAETHLGIAKGASPVLGITFGTGVGSGLVIDGNIYRGSAGYSMELGHTLLSLESEKELEEDLGLRGIRTYLEANTNEAMTGHLQERFPVLSKETEVLFTPLLEKISHVLYNLTLLLSPEVIVISGGIGQNLLPIFGSLLQETLNTHLAAKNYPFRTDIRFSEIKNSGALGAALYASQQK